VGEASGSQQLLSRRLRELRDQHWPGIKVTQAQLARAFSVDRSVSVPLISSWESVTNPKIPPVPRLEAYATFFATTRSLDGEVPRLLGDAELTDTERAVRDDLSKELLRLRAGALGTASPSLPPSVRTDEEENIASLKSGYWRFDDGRPVTMVCAQLPAEMLSSIPYSDPADPDYVALYAYADLDAFVELHGHIRAANPGSQVNFRTAPQLVSDDYTTHLVLLGGIDWNYATESVFHRLSLPVDQVADWTIPDGQYFEVDDDGVARRFRPELTRHGGRKVLREDVALFARAVNPYNRLRTITICNGMYAGGTFGAVRALTDSRFRDRNTRYAKDRFGQCEAFCILTRVRIERGAPLTPDWTLEENRLFEWVSES
jgi:transcriptional regulator with XRE-family HTH domain